MSNLIAINLTEEEAYRFRWFMDHYPSIKLMIDSQVFETKRGNALLSFDNSGTIKSIKRELFSYSS